jgi:methylated-DNA-[protein]-cysteine S-methyltransferase
VIETTGFETAIGRCELGWTERGVARVKLPGSRPTAADATPPAAVRRAIDGIVSLLAGEPADLTSAPLDLGRAEPFDRRVYALAREIPPGETRTYGELARRLGEPDARAVGASLARNPVPLVVPCHRVVAADGGLRGFSAPGGVATKRRLLEIEGAWADAQPQLFELT